MVNSFYFNPVTAKRVPYLLLGTIARLFSRYDFYIIYVYLASIVQEICLEMNCITLSRLMESDNPDIKGLMMCGGKGQ